MVEPPATPALPIHSLLFWFAIAIGLAVPVSIGSAFVAEYLDPTIRTMSEASELLNSPVLAWLPHPEAARASILPISRQKVVLP